MLSNPIVPSNQSKQINNNKVNLWGSSYLKKSNLAEEYKVNSRNCLNFSSAHTMKQCGRQRNNSKGILNIRFKINLRNKEKKRIYFIIQYFLSYSLTTVALIRTQSKCQVSHMEFINIEYSIHILPM